jgi:hypothetical protein
MSSAYKKRLQSARGKIPSNFKPEYDFGAKLQGARFSIPFALYAAVWELGRERFRETPNVPTEWEERPYRPGVDQCLFDLLLVKELRQWWRQGIRRNQWAGFVQRYVNDPAWRKSEGNLRIPCLDKVDHQFDPIRDCRGWLADDAFDPLNELPNWKRSLEFKVQISDESELPHTGASALTKLSNAQVGLRELRNDAWSAATQVADEVHAKVRAMAFRAAARLGVIPAWEFDVHPMTILRHLAAYRLNSRGFNWNRVSDAGIWCAGSSSENWRKSVRTGEVIVGEIRTTSGFQITNGKNMSVRDARELNVLVLELAKKGELVKLRTGALQRPKKVA